MRKPKKPANPRKRPGKAAPASLLAAPRPTPFHALLLAAGLSQRQLSAEIGVDPSYVSHIVRGVKQPSFKRAVAMSKALGVSLDELDRAIWRR